MMEVQKENFSKTFNHKKMKSITFELMKRKYLEKYYHREGENIIIKI